MPAPNLLIGARHPTEVAGVHAVTGRTQPTDDGWFRCDRIVIGSEDIGAVHVKEVHGRVTALSQCGDDYVIGRDVAWIVRTSGKSPQVVPPAPAPTAESSAAPRRMRP